MKVSIIRLQLLQMHFQIQMIQTIQKNILYNCHLKLKRHLIQLKINRLQYILKPIIGTDPYVDGFKSVKYDAPVIYNYPAGQIWVLFTDDFITENLGKTCTIKS